MRHVLWVLMITWAFDASAQAGATAPSERAQRDADKVFQWIKMHSDKPRRARDEKEAKPAAAPSPSPATAAVAAPRAPAVTPQPPPASTAVTTPTVASHTAESSEARQAEAPEVARSAPDEAAALPAPTPEPDAAETLVLTRQVDPEFPGALMRTLRKGTVQVKFSVLPDGSVGQAEVVKTSHGRLNNAAVAAVSEWRFAPIKRTQSGVVELGFNLD